MKTLEEVKDDYAGEQGRDSWEEYFMWLDLCRTSHSVMQQHYDEIAKRYATEYAKEALKNASKGYTPAKIIYNGRTKGYDKVASVKDVLSENNLPKHR